MQFSVVTLRAMSQVTGVILILFAIGLAVFWLASGRRSKPLLKFTCVFIAVLVFLLVLKDKLVEVTIKDWLSIKTSAAEAKSDAETVATIRKQVENQRATIDLVATDAQTARELSEEASNKLAIAEGKLNQLDFALAKANDSLATLDAATEFSILVSKAQNDDRAAFFRLVDISSSTNSPFAESATKIGTTILARVQEETIVEQNNVTIHWDLYGINPDTDSLEKLESFYLSRPYNELLRFAVVHTIFNSKRFSDRDRYDFLVMVIKSDNSLKVVQLAINLMTPESKLRLNIMATGSYLGWWETNRLNYSNSINN